jgi:hypothetical protein
MEDVARRVARAHVDLDPAIVHVYLLQDPSPGDDQSHAAIKMLQVNAESGSAGLLPLYFRAEPDVGIPYPMYIVSVTPSEFERIRRHDLSLPQDWILGEELTIEIPNGQPS